MNADLLKSNIRDNDVVQDVRKVWIKVFIQECVR